MFAKNPSGKIVSVGVFPAAVGTTSLDVILTSDEGLDDATIYAVMWDSANTMVPVAYMMYK